jgi:hypothetical protein
MITAGIVLDQYDDVHCEVLKRKFQEPGNVPDMFKTASVDDPAQLPDECFALILKDGGQRLRKYAMHTPDTCAKSAFYFMECGGKLPPEAQKTAAFHLAEGLAFNGMQPPDDMLKLANAAAVEYREAHPPRQVLDANGRVQAKLAQVARPDIDNVVDVTGRHAEPIRLEQVRPKTAADFALVKEGSARYPINTFDRLTKAVDYFAQHEQKFSPEDRMQYCVKVAAKINELGLELPPHISKYAKAVRDNYTIAVAIEKRAEAIPAYDDLQATLEKIAREVTAMPDYFVVAVLEEFDKLAGLERHWDLPNGVPNPVLSVFREKTAESDDDFVWDHGNERLTGTTLNHFARDGGARDVLLGVMGRDQVDEFISNPIPIFNSLPDPHKIQIARIANDNSDGHDPAHTMSQATTG